MLAVGDAGEIEQEELVVARRFTPLCAQGRRQRDDRFMPRVDLQNRLSEGRLLSMFGQKAGQLAIKPAVRRDKADGAVGQPRRGAHVVDMIPQASP